jgi:hypothetical protein
MTWFLLLALLVAVPALLLAFTGCSFQPGSAASYFTEVASTPNLVSYWRLDETAGPKAVDSKGGNDGTYTGGVTFGVPGLLNDDPDTAAEFDGTSGYVLVPHNDDSLNPPKFTVEALVKPDATIGDGNFHAVLDSQDPSVAGVVNGYSLYAGPYGGADPSRAGTSAWIAYVGDGTAYQRVYGPVPRSDTQYLAMTYDGTTLTLYVDPADETQAWSTAFAYQANTTQELRIGAGRDIGQLAPTYFFPGVLDELAAYNDALAFQTLRDHFTTAAMGLKFA